METPEVNIQVLAAKIKALDTHIVRNIVADIAKASKKKTLSSGTQTFAQFCETVASHLTKQSTKPLIEKYNLG